MGSGEPERKGEQDNTKYNKILAVQAFARESE